MKFTKMPIAGLYIIQPTPIEDSRGIFSENYKLSEFMKAGIKDAFVQENFSISGKGVLRGLHYQKNPYAQAKLVQCTHGAVLDVVVDIRPKSSTYGEHIEIELSEENGLMLYVPIGFAHGFYSLKDNSKLVYRCSKEYSPKHDSGIRWNDPTIGIKWPSKDPILSSKDKNLPFLK
jgi:dTDP-4-dehydrorhamnose 3,5-epimerase